MTINSIPTPFDVRWSTKCNDSEKFLPIDVNAEVYKESTVSLPHPVLVVQRENQLENSCFQIEVSNFIGSTVEAISGKKKLK